MRKPLLHEFREPYVRLADAVRYTAPQIVAEDVSRDLILLARDCLVKDPEIRNRFVDWNRFREGGAARAHTLSARERFLQRIKIGAETNHVVGTTVEPLSPSEQRRICKGIAEQVRSAVRQLCVASQELPPVVTDILPIEGDSVQSFFIGFAPSDDHGFRRHITVLIRVHVLNVRESSVSVAAAASLSANVPPKDAPKTWKDIFNGVLDLDSIKTATEEVIYVALDAAQNGTGEATDGDTTEWIELQV